MDKPIDLKTHKNVRFSREWGGSITLSKTPYDNFVNIGGEDYELKYLNGRPGNKGGNSIVFRLKPVAEEDDFEPENLIIKISKFPTNGSKTSFERNRIARFIREIVAMKKAKQNKLKNVINTFHHGKILVGEDLLNFYTMEEAQSDLADFLKVKKSLQQKLLLCESILKGMDELHGIGIYHRDIKHDNMFIVGQECKIGDLGLVRFRENDDDALDKDQRIGAFGWETPEALNKFLTENIEQPEFEFDCAIDEQSDIFQLGKLFWFIVQGNLPIGQICKDDFKVPDSELFDLLYFMLQHQKVNHRRPQSVREVMERLNAISSKYGAN